MWLIGLSPVSTLQNQFRSVNQALPDLKFGAAGAVGERRSRLRTFSNLFGAVVDVVSEVKLAVNGAWETVD